MAQLRCIRNRRSSRTGLLITSRFTCRCAVGRGGIAKKRGEGDGGTPIGTWSLQELHFRKDRISLGRQRLPAKAIRPRDIWCDNPRHRLYNQLVAGNFITGNGASGEDLSRRDQLYDVFVVLSYNRAPVIANRGSAIFLHLASPDMTPTEGCIAITRSDMRRVLSLIGSTSQITISVGI